MPKVPPKPESSNGELKGKKKRKARQSAKERYAKAREDAQVLGIIDTVPEGAVRNERVDPRIQDEQRFPGLDRLAIQNDGKGWSVPEHVKRKVIEVSAEVLFQAPKTVVSPVSGEVVEIPPNRFEQMQAAKTLMQADKQQWERDNPEEAGKAAGGGDTNVQVVELSELLKRAKEQREVKPDVIDVQPIESPPAQ